MDRQQMRERVVWVGVKHLGVGWAAKILTDWGVAISQAESPPSPSLLILGEDQKQQYESVKLSKIILRDLSMSSHHVLALSGVLVTFGQYKDLFLPQYVVQSCVGNSLAILVLQMLYEWGRSKAPLQQEVSIVEMVRYFGAFNVSAKEAGMISEGRGRNVLEGGAPYYSIFRCKEGHLAVGNLQPKFYAEMVRGLSLQHHERAFCEEGQFTDNKSKLYVILSRKFMQKTADQWEKHFQKYDTCITAIRKPFKREEREPKWGDLNPKL